MILVQNTVAQRETLRVSTLGSQLLERIYPKPTILVMLLPEFPKLPGTGNHPQNSSTRAKGKQMPKGKSHSNREVKKPKKDKKPDLPKPGDLFSKGIQIGGSDKKKS